MHEAPTSSARETHDADTEEPADTSAIREVGAPDAAEDSRRRARNPFDVWIWVVAAALIGFGVFLLAAPVLFAEQYAEMMTGSSSNGFMLPWFSYTTAAASPLLLLGFGTAIAQLFLLSIRHTLRTTSRR